MWDPAGYLGRQTILRLNLYVDRSAFFYRVLGQLIRNPRAGRAMRFRVTIEQIYFTAVQALIIIIPVALLIGTMMILQFSKFYAQYDLGRITVSILIREFGPLLTAFIIILRSASAMTIEMGYMKTLHELETFELQGVDPFSVLFVPRFVGLIISMICLISIFCVIAVLGGYAIAWSITTLPLQQFLYQIAKAITGTDIIVVLMKAVFFGMGISVISIHQGLIVERGMTEVPVVTSQGAMACLIFCVVVNVILFAAFFFGVP